MASRSPIIIRSDGVQGEMPAVDELLVNGYRVADVIVETPGASILLPMDGRSRIVHVTEGLAVDAIPPGELKFWLKQDGIGGHSVSFPVNWWWPNAVATAVASDPDSYTRVHIASNPAGAIEILTSPYGPIP